MDYIIILFRKNVRFLGCHVEIIEMNAVCDCVRTKNLQ